MPGTQSLNANRVKRETKGGDIQTLRSALAGGKVGPRAIKSSVANVASRLAVLQARSSLLADVALSPYVHDLRSTLG